ncbi:MAG: cation-translocating P-type ATPase [Clostridia bacterium]|nr:cation-translocating P-type ATPase [Clostridia bacterium]
MKNISHAGADNLEALSRTNLSRSKRRQLKKEIISAAVTLICIAVGLIYEFLIPSLPIVAPLLYTIGFLVEGIPVFIAAIKGIFSRDFTNAMEMLVSIAILACYISGELILSAMIPLILNIAHFLEERSIVGGRDIIDGLRQMQQSSAILLENGEETRVDSKTLKIGQKILVKPGAGVPIDGVVIGGESHIDQKSLTGEPESVHVTVGSPVYAGTVNLDSPITVEVQKEFVDTSFSHILTFLEKAERIAVPESRLIDRFMMYYIPFVLALAGAVALFTSDLSKAIAILVVSCPCGQMLVSSAPMIASLSVATKRGILIKNSKFLEETNAIDAVVFDKTGTITKGNLSLTDRICAEGVADEALLDAALLPANHSTHPISQAVVAAAEGREISAEGYTVREVSGKGLEAVHTDGRILRFGNEGWLSTLGIEIPEEIKNRCFGSVSYVTENNNLLGALCFNDTARPDAKDAIDALKKLDIEQFVMLTGDRPEVAEKISRETGIEEWKAQLLPEDKLDSIREIKKNRCVLAIGDGINDALALKEAHVGIAMGAIGSDLAIQSADIALMSDNLMNIPFAITLAKRTRKIIYQNLGLSLGISFLMIVLSSFGVISVLAGSILHNIGAFVVILNSSRILKLNQENQPEEPKE